VGISDRLGETVPHAASSGRCSMMGCCSITSEVHKISRWMAVEGASSCQRIVPVVAWIPPIGRAFLVMWTPPAGRTCSVERVPPTERTLPTGRTAKGPRVVPPRRCSVLSYVVTPVMTGRFDRVSEEGVCTVCPVPGAPEAPMTARDAPVRRGASSKGERTSLAKPTLPIELILSVEGMSSTGWAAKGLARHLLGGPLKGKQTSPVELSLATEGMLLAGRTVEGLTQPLLGGSLC
jgi:hypothetical protein